MKSANFLLLFYSFKEKTPFVCFFLYGIDVFCLLNNTFFNKFNRRVGELYNPILRWIKEERMRGGYLIYVNPTLEDYNHEFSVFTMNTMAPLQDDSGLRTHLLGPSISKRRNRTWKLV